MNVQTTLATVSLAVSIVSMAASTFISGRKDDRIPWTGGALSVWFGALITGGIIATIPSAPPFAPGMALGWGLLIGGIAGLYATVELSRSWSRGDWLDRGVGLMGAATAGPALAWLLFPDDPQATLVGIALAGLLLALLWRLCVAPTADAEHQDDASRAAVLGAEVFALVAAAVAVASWLAAERFTAMTSEAEVSRILPVLIASASGLAALVPAKLASSGGRRAPCERALLIGIIAAAIVAVGVAVLGSDLLEGSSVLLTVVAGLAGLAIAALLACVAGAERVGEEPHQPLVEVFGTALVALALVAVGFKLLHGFGEGLALVAGAAPIVFVACATAPDRRQVVAPLATGAFALVLLLATYRVLIEQGGTHYPLKMQQHYVYLGLVLGAASGFALLAWMTRLARVARDAREDALVRLMTLAPWPLVALVLVPMAILIVWGYDAVGGLLVGLVIAQLGWMMLVAWSAQERQAAVIAAPQVFLAAAALVTAHLAPRVMEAVDLTRTTKAVIIIVVAAAALAWVAGAVWPRITAAAGGDVGDEE